MEIASVIRITALGIKHAFLSVLINNLCLDCSGCQPGAQIIPMGTGLIIKQRVVYFGILQKLFKPHKAFQRVGSNGFEKQIVLAAVAGFGLRHKSNIFRINC